MYRLSLKRIEHAAGVIDPVFLRTPQFICEPLGDALGVRLVLKVESLNPIRSFKGRGATFSSRKSRRARRWSARAPGTSVRRWRTPAATGARP